MVITRVTVVKTFGCPIPFYLLPRRYLPYAEKKFNEGLRGFVFWQQLPPDRQRAVAPSMNLSSGGAFS